MCIRDRYRYKAFYSLDCDDGIENAAVGWAQPSPEDCLMEKEAQAEYAELLRRGLFIPGRNVLKIRMPNRKTMIAVTRWNLRLP